MALLNAANRHLKTCLLCLSCALALAISLTTDAGEDSNPTDSFLSSHLSGSVLDKANTLWVSGELRETAESVLGHRFGGLRVRYWGENNRTLWILEEIGKEMPITIGVVVDSGKISSVQILKYRETRGGEVRYPFFTKQFRGLGLANDDQNALTDHIDGISGATLSVAAVRKTAILALIFHRHTPFGSGQIES